MAIVYVPHIPHRMKNGVLVPQFDLSAAEEFGELRSILDKSRSPFETESVISDMQGALANFNNDDFLLLIGSPVFIGLATAVAAYINYGMVNLLQWNGKKRCYIPIEVDLPYDM